MIEEYGEVAVFRAGMQALSFPPVLLTEAEELSRVQAILRQRHAH